MYKIMPPRYRLQTMIGILYVESLQEATRLEGFFIGLGQNVRYEAFYDGAWREGSVI